jgi:hypothetical protein
MPRVTNRMAENWSRSETQWGNHLAVVRGVNATLLMSSHGMISFNN